MFLTFCRSHSRSSQQQKAKTLTKSIVNLDKDLKEANVELSSFHLLRSHEQQAIPTRKEGLQQEVVTQERRQSDLQQRYKELVQRLEALRAQ